MTTTAETIFIGRKQSGKGFRCYVDVGSLLTVSPRIERIVDVQFTDGRWIEGNQALNLPEDAQAMIGEELKSRQWVAMRSHRRICHSNSSYDAAQSRGIVAKIYVHKGDYVVHVTAWSKWAGDGDTTTISDPFATLDEARNFAERECTTRPSFGDVEWY